MSSMSNAGCVMCFGLGTWCERGDPALVVLQDKVGNIERVPAKRLCIPQDSTNIALGIETPFNVTLLCSACVPHSTIATLCPSHLLSLSHLPAGPHALSHACLRPPPTDAGHPSVTPQCAAPRLTAPPSPGLGTAVS